MRHEGPRELRLVAPIFPESRVHSGPYMLFDHTVRAGWVEKIPAVIHLDGTAWLQTINARQNSVVERSARGIRKVEQNSSFVQYQRQSQRPRIFFGRAFGGAVETR